jgi:hypothetical protein
MLAGLLIAAIAVGGFMFGDSSGRDAVAPPRYTQRPYCERDTAKIRETEIQIERCWKTVEITEPGPLNPVRPPNQ